MNIPAGGTRYAIVTGAASGLGRAICLRLARDHWQIVVCDIDLDGARDTLELVKTAGGTGQVERLDVSDPEQWVDLKSRLQASWPMLDLLVNNAGVACAGEIGRLSLENWHWTLNANLHGVIYGCHTMVPWLKANPQGAHVVNVASIAGMLAPPSMGPYNVSKAGVIALSETMYSELRSQNVGVTVVCPGFFRTRLLDSGRFDTAKQREAANRYTNEATTNAEEVADRTVRAIGTRQLYVIVPRRARTLWRVKRLWPKLLPDLFGRAFRAAKHAGAPAEPAATTDDQLTTGSSARR